MFGSNSAKRDLILIKSHLLPILVNERDIKTTVIKKRNKLISFKLGDFQLFDITTFLGRATSLDSFLKAYKTSETKRFFPYEWFDQLDKMQKTDFPPYEAFYKKRCNCNTFEAKHADYVNFLKSLIDHRTSRPQIKTNRATPYWD